MSDFLNSELFDICYVFLAVFLSSVVFFNLRKKSKTKHLEGKVFLCVALPILILGTLLDTSMGFQDKFIALGIGLCAASLNWYFFFRKLDKP